MKIDLHSIDPTQFNVEESVILVCGRPIHFITPNPAGVIEWDNSNAHLRSSVWDKSGNLICAGFKKFFELGENEKFAASPKDLNDVQVYEKYDGTLLIVSIFGRHTFIRTRGRLDAETIDKKEIDLFKRRILPRLCDNYGSGTWGCSFLFEWVSPKHRQVVNYGADQPFFVLVGGINHQCYDLMPQATLDYLANNLAFSRPQLIQLPTLAELKTYVENLKDKEGVVLYSKGGQVMHKLKSKWYYAFHRLFEKGTDRENIIDAWLSANQPSYNEFTVQLSKTFTPEYADLMRGDVSVICDAWKEASNIINGMNEFVQTKLVPLSPAKEVEAKIHSAYGTTNRAEYVLKLYRGQSLTEDDRKKLLYQCLKNR